MKYDENLVKMAIASNSTAFEELYNQIHKDMYRFSFFMLGNKEDALDAVSDAVTDMYKYIGNLKSYKAFSSWAMRILWTKCKQKRKEYALKSNEVELKEALEVSQSEDRIDNIYLKNELMALNEDERTIILLNVVYGYNSREISKLIHMKDSTVRSKQSRALKKMKERMSNYGR